MSEEGEKEAINWHRRIERRKKDKERQREGEEESNKINTKRNERIRLRYLSRQKNSIVKIIIGVG